MEASNVFHAYIEMNPGVDACEACSCPRSEACHPQPVLPLDRAHIAEAYLVQARIALVNAAEQLGQDTSTTYNISSNLFQRANSLDSIQECLRQSVFLGGPLFRDTA